MSPAEWAKLETRLDSIDEKLESFQPMLQEYNAHKIIMKKFQDWGKIIAMVIGILVGASKLYEGIGPRRGDPTPRDLIHD